VRDASGPATIELMRISWIVTASAYAILITTQLNAQQKSDEKPLTALPYTPSLDARFVDKTADPCTDFYRYACGNWNKLNPIPPDQARWNVYTKLADENQRFLWGILEQAARANASRSPNEQKIGDFFHSCMDEAAIEQAGIQPLQPMLEKIAKLKSINDLGAYIGEQHKNGVDRGVLFGFESSQDFDNSSQVIAFAEAGGLGLPDRDCYTKTDPKSQEIRQRYSQHVQRMLELIGESATDAQTDAQSVMAIETALAKASLTRVEKRNPYNLKHKISRDDLLHMVPAFNWDAYLDVIPAPQFEQLNVEEPKFFDELNNELRNQALPAWKAYLRWHLVHSEAPYLSSKFVEESFDYYSRYLQGVQQMPPRWKTCTRLVDQDLGEALGQNFVAKTFSPQTKQDALKMTQEIEAEMGRDIKDLTWMSEPTKQRALEKLHAVVNKIGYPDKWRDYSSVQITPDDFLGNVSRASAFEERRQLAKIGKPVVAASGA